MFELILTHFRFEQNPAALPDHEIRGLTAPTYLMMGQYERSFDPYAVIKRGLTLLPNLIRAEIVPGVGHGMVHRQPDWITARVIRFLESHTI